eukprot:365334-Chlamydomonas_euryale.AAC.8
MPPHLSTHATWKAPARSAIRPSNPAHDPNNSTLASAPWDTTSATVCGNGADTDGMGELGAGT